ncbi:MAG: radical SAM protein [Planctomycetaceae bacterium]|jgi:radical SAM protein with 4Fe4S-binding SPASM domain|nr:radical SAM protein [Planctomycetaceae bacterium]
MKAKIATRYLQTGRADLSKVIPLQTPFLIFVDPSSRCNFACRFCPCGNAHRDLWRVGRTADIMPFDLFCKIIDDLEGFPDRIKTLRLYKDGEPLLNKNLPAMIGYARKKNFIERIDFTTNASLLNKELSQNILNAGVTRIIVSVEALSEEGYNEISNIKINFQQYIDNIAFLYENSGDCIVFLKISDLGLKINEREKFFELFGNICDEIAIESISPSWPDFDISDIKNDFKSDIYGSENLKESLVCPFIFYSICVNANGMASACFSDWNHKLLAGDVKKQSLVEIWNGDYMNRLRRMMLEGQRNKIDVCNHCGQLTYCAQDSIDDSRTALLEKMFG